MEPQLCGLVPSILPGLALLKIPHGLNKSSMAMAAENKRVTAEDIESSFRCMWLLLLKERDGLVAVQIAQQTCLMPLSNPLVFLKPATPPWA